MFTRRIQQPLLLATALLTLSACGSHEPAQQAQSQQTQPSAPQPLFKPVATIHDLMTAEVDPFADEVWDAVGTDISAKGIEDKQPRTPEEWAVVRQGAIRLLEATNLLLIEGRHVASTPFGPEAQGALGSDEIERRINANRTQFDRFAVSLRETGLQALAAVDAHDAKALLRVGGELDSVCESCHLTFWYPDQVIPAFQEQAAARFGTAANARN